MFSFTKYIIQTETFNYINCVIVIIIIIDTYMVNNDDFSSY